MSNQKNPCMNYAIYYLHSVPKTEKQMKVKLLEKWYPEKEIDSVILELKKMWYIDDENFARLYINSEAVSKWKPIFRVKWKLIEKWIDKKIIEKISSELEQDIVDWTKQKIRKEIEKLKSNWVEWYDIMTKLYSKWYSISLLKEVVNGD